MKRLITTLSIISVALISCQQNLVPDHPEIPATADEVMTKSLSSVGKVTPDDPVVFLSELETNFWSQTVSLDDRFKAFEVPSSRLSEMTTEALAKSILNYPLNYLVFAYDPKDAVDLIIKNSPLHQEFLSRTDAFKVLVDLYADSEMDMRPEKSNYDGDYANLSYTNTMFIEALLGTKVLNTLGRASEKQKLTNAIAAKLQSRLQKPEIFGISSIEPLMAIDKAEGLNVVSVDTRSGPYMLQDIYTPWGQKIIAKAYASDGTSSEIAQWTAQATSAHPNAIVRGPATHKYNSHSYAWHNQSTSNNIWFEYEDAKKYWTNDLYTSFNVTSANATKAVYETNQHSAIPLSNGKYLSKWGCMPLMEHASNDCPYSANSSLTFYKKSNPEYFQMSITGQTSVVKGQTYLYAHTGQLINTNIEWEVRYMDSPTPAPFVLTDFDTYANIRFDDYGYYKVIVRGYRNGIEMAYGMLEVLCLP